MDTGKTDIVIAGAGVIGLAIGAALAKGGREVFVLEAASRIGSETSSRNSEVIHAGIYYSPASLKARLCVAGRRQLYRYCDDRKVEFRKCGKLIVANDQFEETQLEALALRARANGVDDLEEWTGRQVIAAEPQIRAMQALHSPSTGIVDSHGLMLALLGELEDHGGMVAFNTRIASGIAQPNGWRLDIASDQPMALDCAWLINAAGLGAPALASSLEGLEPQHVPKQALAKGSYFSLASKAPATRLIYPAPSEAGLGIHLTLDLAGQARFGPDVEWIDKCDYTVDPTRGEQFYSAIRRYWPGLPDGALRPDYSGIRPKLVGQDEAAADFRIDGPARHRLYGLVNLFGIESPGLTAALAIANTVAAIVLDRDYKELDL